MIRPHERCEARCLAEILPAHRCMRRWIIKLKLVGTTIHVCRSHAQTRRLTRWKPKPP